MTPDLFPAPTACPPATKPPRPPHWAAAASTACRLALTAATTAALAGVPEEAFEAALAQARTAYAQTKWRTAA